MLFQQDLFSAPGAAELVPEIDGKISAERVAPAVLHVVGVHGRLEACISVQHIVNHDAQVGPALEELAAEREVQDMVGGIVSPAAEAVVERGIVAGVEIEVPEDGRQFQSGRERCAAILVRLAGRVLRVDIGGRRTEGKAHLVREITFEPEVCAGDMAARAVGPVADIARDVLVGVPD